MIASMGRMGRVAVLRLGDGDRIPECIEEFARESGILRAAVLLLGGVGSGTLVAGPKDGAAASITPMTRAVADVHEASAVGSLFPDEQGAPRLHLHAALGRGDDTLVGCARRGLDIWKIAEVMLLEIEDCDLVRKVDPAFGFEVLAKP